MGALVADNAPAKRRLGRAGRGFLLGIVVGLLIGVGATFWTWQLKTNNGANADGQLACEVVARIKVDMLGPPGQEGDELTAHRWAAVRAAGNAAATQDGSYQPFAAAIDQANTELLNPAGPDRQKIANLIRTAKDRCLYR
ncbi:hypothetical protein EV191_103110 [Tamaricihabitans halophyticus]|uniref:Uncharacterized protein n=1 Tax=Tamaricihabitans halophyticus TaxID=1262583 RepID=A0A4R2QY29_9PSEU|nr:hypothetical protein [Tamaricihabitans halophyticus]TCP54069.1 hypothetical protein EV191_103110 [Tamaricihabitans halophyticus]